MQQCAPWQEENPEGEICRSVEVVVGDVAVAAEAVPPWRWPGCRQLTQQHETMEGLKLQRGEGG